ncbi:MAG: DUF5698 domain-containing protein [Anaerolineales bacterium]|nr:DUF5698 domain-containing protein [Anaerolineales bacterium]
MLQFIEPLRELAQIGLDWDRIPVAIVPLIIFALRTTDIALSTLRMLMVLRSRRTAAWVLAFFQSVIYLIGIAGVINNLNNPLNLLAFAAGFASGNVAGIMLENRLAPGHSHLRIISTGHGAAILERLHEAEIGATDMTAGGRDGTVDQIYCFIPRRKARATIELILSIDPSAFISAAPVRRLDGGWQA